MFSVKKTGVYLASLLAAGAIGYVIGTNNSRIKTSDFIFRGESLEASLRINDRVPEELNSKYKNALAKKFITVCYDLESYLSTPEHLREMVSGIDVWAAEMKVELLERSTPLIKSNPDSTNGI